MSPGVQSRDDTPDGGEDGRGREIIFIPWACRRGDLLLVACSRTHLSCKRDQARLSIAPRRPTPTFTSSWNVAPTERSRWSATMQRPASDNREAQSSTSRSRAGSTPFAPDSSLEGGGFELPARERCKRGLRRKSPASAACRRRSSAAAVGSHQLRAPGEISEPNPYHARNRKFEFFLSGTRDHLTSDQKISTGQPPPR